jgi:hypothetical protein
MDATLTLQVPRRALSAVTPTLPGASLWCWLRRLGRSGGGGRQVRKQLELVGTVAFAPGPVQAPEHSIEAGLDLAQFAVAAGQGVEQFLEHALEDDGIIGQLRDIAGRRRGGRRSAHALIDATAPPSVRGRHGKKSPAGSGIVKL